MITLTGFKMTETLIQEESSTRKISYLEHQIASILKIFQYIMMRRMQLSHWEELVIFRLFINLGSIQKFLKMGMILWGELVVILDPNVICQKYHLTLQFQLILFGLSRVTNVIIPAMVLDKKNQDFRPKVMN